MRLPISLRRGSDAVSPTAHYTGQVWVRNGLSHPELATTEGRVFFDALAGAMLASRLGGGPTLEAGLVARHLVIDAVLRDAIDAGTIGQVIEVAAGRSPRGWRFSERYGQELVYVEADLPAMAARKRRALERMGSLSETHRVAELDVLREGGPGSLAEVAGELDPAVGTAIITEGLLTYLDHPTVLSLLRRFADVLHGFPAGLYLSDLRLSGDAGNVERGFYLFLSAFVRGRVHMHFETEADAIASLQRAGFTDAELHRGDSYPGVDVDRSNPATHAIRIIEART